MNYKLGSVLTRYVEIVDNDGIITVTKNITPLLNLQNIWHMYVVFQTI